MKLSDYSYQITASQSKLTKFKPFETVTKHFLTIYDMWDLNKYHRLSIFNNNIFICHIYFFVQTNTTSIQLRMADGSHWNKFTFESALTNPKINLLEILKREQLYPSLAEDLERACN